MSRRAEPAFESRPVQKSKPDQRSVAQGGVDRRLFDQAVAAAGSPSQQVAAMSELLRRAARRKHAGADTLDGEDWLRCLDEGLSQSVFSAGAGALLRDGGFRTDVAANEVDALRVVARARFLDWMRGA